MEKRRDMKEDTLTKLRDIEFLIVRDTYARWPGQRRPKSCEIAGPFARRAIEKRKAVPRVLITLKMCMGRGPLVKRSEPCVDMPVLRGVQRDAYARDKSGW